MEDKQREEVSRQLINGYNLKKKLEELADSIEQADKKKKKVSDPLTGMKAVTKHYGMNNRLK